ncbi:hypothetical protein HN51_018258 [Arachis hypogaea]|uniref:Uncharacterized protein n=2 Tax=Arachis TaxID=3817 RepID=A0A445BSY8_ARAHY|nr:uncharacterized protein LOC107460661 [Arachis duranensis]XP_025616288.1 uncharacterized protein LOC112708328 [Arachis hypogaea]QHO29876.1 uncharacterized protein DS421_8g228630 [Arachis hypogaea]RYR41762.1 hypothetical protein Ahy_A08g038173 [Arachis hypogaea]
MMRRLRLCCEGVDDINLENEPYYKKKEQRNKTVVEPHRELYTKPWEGSVFPKKRKNLKNLVCKFVVHCICGKCYKESSDNKANKFLPPTSSSNFKSIRNSNAGAANYGNETQNAPIKWWQMK